MLDKVALFLGGKPETIETKEWNISVGGFVLRGHAPKRNAFLLVLFEESDEILGPGFVIFSIFTDAGGVAFDTAISRAIAVGLHPVGRRPRTGEEFETAFSLRLGVEANRLQSERNLQPKILVD